MITSVIIFLTVTLMAFLFGNFKIDNFKKYKFWLLFNVIFFPIVLNYIYNFFDKVFLGYKYLFAKLSINNWSILFQFIILIIVLDFLKYLTHYLFHRIPTLWKIHQVHHAQNEITYLSSFKHSWIEGFAQIPIGLSISLIANPEIKLLILTNTIFFIICIWQHSHFWSHLNFGGHIMSPWMHKVHHRITNSDETSGNYGLLFLFWDKIFGTFIFKDENEILKYGIVDSTYPNSFWKEFLRPLRF